MERKLFTCAEVAEIYGVKKATVWSWVRSGKLGSIVIGRCYRIRQQDLDVFEQKINEK